MNTSLLWTVCGRTLDFGIQMHLLWIDTPNLEHWAFFLTLLSKFQLNNDWKKEIHWEDLGTKGLTHCKTCPMAWLWELAWSSMVSFLALLSTGTRTRIRSLHRSLKTKLPPKKRLTRVIGDGKLVDERVYEWFASACSRNILVSGRILQEKALKVAEGPGVATLLSRTTPYYSLLIHLRVYNLLLCKHKQHVKKEDIERNPMKL